MNGYDREFMRAMRIPRDELPEPTLPETDTYVIGYAADGSRWVPLDDVKKLIAANQSLVREGMDYQRAAVRWCGEARDASRELRAARATAFVLVGLIFAMGVVHALLG